jgi:uncharacterized membrane protein
MVQWLRRRFVAGFFVVVPVVASVAALVWTFRVIDGFTAPIYARLLGWPVPGLGLLTTVIAVLLVGVVATNVIGRRLLMRVEHWLLLVPLFRTVYAPVKQLVLAFSPDNEYGFKQVVLVEEPGRRYVIGFLTREFTAGEEGKTQALAAVYVPTNHLYLGDVVVYAREQLIFPDLSVEEGVRLFLTGGMALPSRIDVRRATTRGAEVPPPRQP